MIGTKTLAALTLCAAVVAAATLLGSFSLERLGVRGFGALFVIGSFGVVVGTLAFRFGRLGDKSRHYFRYTHEAAAWNTSERHFLGGARRRIVIGENTEGEAFDLSPRARLVASVAIAAILALAAIGSRALDQLSLAYDRAASAKSAAFCPDEEEKPPQAKDPNEPGCELVRRAYALGYAKGLGECAPKKETAGVAARLVCTRRQRDEPVLHYWWRLLADFTGNLRRTTRVGYFKQSLQDFRRRSAHLASLGRAEGEIIASAPHAAHHVWTNLPDPMDGAFEAATCTGRYLRLPHRPDPPGGPMRASKVFEHVMAQLLFEGTYDGGAHCREYHVHWGAPVDACERLAKSPEVFLRSQGALDDIKGALERYRVAMDLTSLGGPKPPLPSFFLSFGCYVEGDGPAEVTTPLTFSELPFTADTVRVLPSLPEGSLFVDRYDAVARLFVKGFHYGSLLSEAGLETGATGNVEAAFASSEFLLTHAYELDGVDIYVDPGWISRRPDLLHVYPYERHLKNYVEFFRRQYRRERGRL